MRYYLNIGLPPELESEVLAIEQEWQGNSKSKPHLTLDSPKEAPPELEESQMVAEYMKVASQIPCFKLEYGGIGEFNQKSTIYLQVKRSQALLDLARKLKIVSDRYLSSSRSQFDSLEVPHITLATHLTGEKAEAACQTLKNLPLSGSFTCRSVNLLRIDKGDKQWTIIAELPLASP
jgi:2'-5' RNA ligase